MSSLAQACREKIVFFGKKGDNTPLKVGNAGFCEDRILKAQKCYSLLLIGND